MQVSVMCEKTETKSIYNINIINNVNITNIYKILKCSNTFEYILIPILECIQNYV